MIIQMAWRNLWRRPRRTILSSLAIVFTTTLLIFMPSMQNGSYDTMIESTLRMYDGYAEIQQPGYRDNPEVRNSIESYEHALAQLKKIPGMEAVGVRADGAAVLSSPTRSLGAQVVGVLPDAEPKLSTIPSNIHSGRYLSGLNSAEIVMGEILAKNLHLELGDRVTLLGMGRDGSLAADSLELVGTFRTGVTTVDRLMSEMPLGRFQESFTMDGHAHAIVMNGKSITDFKTVQQAATSVAENNELVLLDWKQLQPGLWQGIILDISSAMMVYVALVVVVAFSLLNSILMSVLERTREFGVLLALGMRPSQISKMVWVETLLMLLFGLGGGMLLGYGITEYYGHVGIHFEEAQQVFEKYGLPSAIYPDINAFTLLAGPFVIGFSVLLAGVFPVIRIHSMEAVTAMRTV